MKKKKKISRKKEVKEKVCEVFNVENNGKEETIKTCGVEEEIVEKNGQIEDEKKTLKKVFIVLGILSAVLIITALIVYLSNNFEYRGTKFQIKKEGNLILYNTFIPVKYTDGKTGKTTDAKYNFYLRNDPRKLDRINFQGEIKLSKTAVLNMTGTDFNCGGDGVIGIANLQKMYNVLGVNVIKDEKAVCDSNERYMFIQIQPGEENSIKQTGPVCYTLSVKDCDILKVTERMMAETLVRYNEVKK